MIIDSIHTVNIYSCVLIAQVKYYSNRLFLCILSIHKSSIIVYYNNCKQDTATAIQDKQPDAPNHSIQ